MTDPDNTCTDPHAESDPAKTGHTPWRVADRRARLLRVLALDTTSGILLLAFAAIAVVWANTPWREAYHHLLAIEVGPESLHLHLTLAQWAADGLLAIFFFVVGVELKHEFVAGGLRDLRLAGVPIAAAVGGMVTPARCICWLWAPPRTIRRRCTAGRHRRPPTSPSPWRSSPSAGAAYRWRCAPSC